MLKKRNVLVGTLVAIFTIILFASIAVVTPQGECELGIEREITLSVGEGIEFDREGWRVNVEPLGVVEVFEDRLQAVKKGQTKIAFQHEKIKTCFFEVVVEVVNFNSETGSQKLEEELGVSLHKAQINGKILFLSPDN